MAAGFKVAQRVSQTPALGHPVGFSVNDLMCL